MLPLSSLNRVAPGVPTRILGSPKYGPLMLQRLYLSGAGTPGGARDWVVNDVEVDGVSQLAVKDLPGALFGTRGVVTDGKHAMSVIHFSGLDVIEREGEVAVTVTYVGPNPEGVPFFASIVGDSPPQRPTVLPLASEAPIRSKVTISARLDVALAIDLLEIESGSEGADWIVHDIRVDGTTQFAQSGPIPGDVFSTSAIDSFVTFAPGRLLEVDVEYIGEDPTGIRFVGRIFGTVERDNYEQQPPDVRAIVCTSGQATFGEEVVARCNWRAPYVRPSAP